MTKSNQRQLSTISKRTCVESVQGAMNGPRKNNAPAAASDPAPSSILDNFRRDAHWQENRLVFRRRVVATLVPDHNWPGMWRVRIGGQVITGMVNLSRAKDAASNSWAVARRPMSEKAPKTTVMRELITEKSVWNSVYRYAWVRRKTPFLYDIISDKLDPKHRAIASKQ